MQQVMAQRRMAQQQAQVDEVCGIMKNNVEKVLERDTKLTELDERADALQDGASQFEKQAGKLKNKFWLQNMKFIVIGAILGLILLIMLYFKFSDEPQQPIYYQSPPSQPLGPDGKPLPGPQQMQQVMAQRRMAQQQAQVDEVCGIMKDNLEKVLERDSKLNELDERADALQDGASQFEKQAGKLKNKFWLQNLKSMIMMGAVGLILLLLVYWKFFASDPAPNYYYPPPPPPPPPGQSQGHSAADAGVFRMAEKGEKPERPLGPDGKPIPGPEQMRQIQASRKMGQQQAQVDEVIGMMHKNVEEVLERDTKLNALEERADALQDGSAQFEKRAASLKNKFWLENLKSMIAMGIIGLILLAIIYYKFLAPPPQPAYPPGYMQPPPPPPPSHSGSGGGSSSEGSSSSE
eukprot:TCALIF_10758-PA protein Name:"Similar to Syb Synaptobrevin (Drosophila melanogaster)" AED:0.18 eAED:0.21 QI:58/0.33/0.25/1/0.33/0.25/4/229/405